MNFIVFSACTPRSQLAQTHTVHIVGLSRIYNSSHIPAISTTIGANPRLWCRRQPNLPSPECFKSGDFCYTDTHYHDRAIPKLVCKRMHIPCTQADPSDASRGCLTQHHVVSLQKLRCLSVKCEQARTCERRSCCFLRCRRGHEIPCQHPPDIDNRVSTFLTSFATLSVEEIVRQADLCFY